MKRKWPCPGLSILVGLPLSLLFGIPSPPRVSGQQAQQMTIVGQIRTEWDRVIPSGVTVRVEGFDGRRITEQAVDATGLFEISGLRRETYRLTVDAEGFYPVQEVLTLKEVSGHIARLRFVLTARTGVVLSRAEPIPALTDLSAPRKARKAFEKGMRALGEKDLTGAQSHFEKAVHLFPCYARAQTKLGLILSARHDLAGGETALRQAISCDRDFPDAYLALTQLLIVEKKYVEGAATVEEGVRRFPGAWEFYDQLATAHYNLKEYGKAEQEWLKVRSLNPAPPAELHVKFAAVYFRQGAGAKAVVEMQAYLRAEPAGRFAAQVKKLVEQLDRAGMSNSTPALETLPQGLTRADSLESRPGIAATERPGPQDPQSPPH